MGNILRITGIYDGQTLVNLANLSNIWDFGFDFRPKSFNFLPQHEFLSLLAEHYSVRHNYFLQYSQEKSFMIGKMLQDVEKLFISRYSGRGKMSNIWLDFSDELPFEFYDSFHYPYLWAYRPESWSLIKTARFLRGIILPFTLLEQYHLQGVFYQFAAEYVAEFQNWRQENNLLVGLAIDWDSNIFPGIMECFNFDFLSLALNKKIEDHYRHINQEKLQQRILMRRNLWA